MGQYIILPGGVNFGDWIPPQGRGEDELGMPSLVGPLALPSSSVNCQATEGTTKDTKGPKSAEGLTGYILWL